MKQISLIKSIKKYLAVEQINLFFSRYISRSLIKLLFKITKIVIKVLDIALSVNIIKTHKYIKIN